MQVLWHMYFCKICEFCNVEYIIEQNLATALSYFVRLQTNITTELYFLDFITHLMHTLLALHFGGHFMNLRKYLVRKVSVVFLKDNHVRVKIQDTRLLGRPA